MDSGARTLDIKSDTCSCSYKRNTFRLPTVRVTQCGNNLRELYYLGIKVSRFCSNRVMLFFFLGKPALADNFQCSPKGWWKGEIFSKWPTWQFIQCLVGPGGGWPVLKSFVYNQTKELLKCDLFWVLFNLYNFKLVKLEKDNMSKTP